MTTEVTRFLHASDIHLGCQQYRNEYRTNDFTHAFKEILELAVRYNVDFIILGGDVFTSLEMLPGKLTDIINLLIIFKKQSIPIITIEGNHDIRKFSRGMKFSHRDQSWLKLLASLGLIILLDGDTNAPVKHIFKLYDFTINKGGKIQIKDAIIYGTRYLGEKPVEQLSMMRKAIDNEDGKFHILLQHFGVEGTMEGVPGIKLEHIQHLKHRIHYLALGHFHKQFIIDDWIYNPGSSEATGPIDNSFQRGVFLVEFKKDKKYLKDVKMLKLNNRKYFWKTLCFSHQLRDKNELHSFILKELNSCLKHLNPNLKPEDKRIPVLCLKFEGRKPHRNYKINEKELREIILEKLPVVDIKIYQKFQDSTITLEKYI